MRKLISIVVGLFIFSQAAQAFTECALTPTGAWLALDGNNVWICFDKGNCVYKELGGAVTEKHLGRMYAMGLTAISAQKMLAVRYTDALTCSALGAGNNSNRLDGIWIIK